MNLLFYVSGAIAIISALTVITRKNAAHAVVFLVAVFLATSSVFYTLGAPFIAVLQVLIYAGAIIVLFVFVVMILNLGHQAEEQERVWLKWPIWVVPVVLVILLTGQFVMVLVKPAGERTSPLTRGTIGGAFKPESTTQSYALKPNIQHPQPPPSPLLAKVGEIGPSAVGQSLFSDYIIGVEIASMMLLAGLVAAFHLGYRSRQKEAEDE